MTFSSRRSQLFLIYLLAFVCAVGNPIVVPNLPFIMEEFRLTAIEMGLVISLFALPGAIIIPLYGVLCDRIGRRPMLIMCLLTCILGSLFSYYAPSFSWLLVGRMLQGLSFTPLEALSNTLASDLFEGEARLKCIARCTSIQYFSVAITPLIVTSLTSWAGWRVGFAFSTALAGTALFLCLPIRIAYRSPENVTFRKYGSHIRQILTSFRVLSLFSVRVAVAFIIFGVVYPHFALLLTMRLGVPAEETGFTFSGYAIGMFLGALFIPLAIRWFKPRTIGFVGGLQLCAATVILFLAENSFHVFIALLLIGTGSGMLTSCCAGHVSLASSPDTRGSIMSAYSTVFRMGQTVAPLLFGMIFQSGGFEGLLGACFAVTLFLMGMAGYSFSYADRIEHQADTRQHGDSFSS